MSYFPTENIILFGSGSAARDWLYANKSIPVKFIVDNDSCKHGGQLHGIDIVSPDILIEKNSIYNVLIVSAYVQEIREQLEGYGYTWEVNVFSALNQFELLLPASLSVGDFFEKLNQSNASYVVIRNYENLPTMTGGDIDILINDNDIELLLDCGLLRSEFRRSSGEMPPIKIDAYSVYGSIGYRYRNIALFPPNFANRILKNRVLANNNVYIPGPEDAVWSYLYYICYFKNIGSGIPPVDENPLRGRFREISSQSDFLKYDHLLNIVRHDYKKYVSNVFNKINKNVSLRSIHEYLASQQLAPPLSVVRRHVENLDAIGLSGDYLIETVSWYADYKNILYHYPGLAIYFVRERAYRLSALDEILNFLNGSELEILFVHELIDREQVVNACRGGNWFDDRGVCLNGEPVTLIFLNDVNLRPLSAAQSDLNIPFVKYASYFVKDALRSHLSEKYIDEFDLNLVHSTDDTFEVFETIGNLGSADKNKVIDSLNEWLPNNLRIKIL